MNNYVDPVKLKSSQILFGYNNEDLSKNTLPPVDMCWPKHSKRKRGPVDEENIF